MRRGWLRPTGAESLAIHMQMWRVHHLTVGISMFSTIYIKPTQRILLSGTVLQAHF